MIAHQDDPGFWHQSLEIVNDIPMLFTTGFLFLWRLDLFLPLDIFAPPLIALIFCDPSFQSTSYPFLLKGLQHKPEPRINICGIIEPLELPVLS